MEELEIRGLRPGEEGQRNALLEREGLQQDGWLDYSAGVFDGGELVAVGSCAGNTLRCLAVDSRRRGEGILSRLVRHLIEVQYRRGNYHLFLYTKGAAAPQFEDLGFHEIARDGQRAVFLENRKTGFSDYLQSLRKETPAAPAAPQGAVVMNANPFTLGHQYLAEKAAEALGTLHLFVVSEDLSVFPAADRMALVKAGTAHLPNVVYHQTDSYLISRATFPSYFLKDGDQAALAQARLDGAVFAKIAEALGITLRFLGTEPTSRVTALYNQALSEVLPPAGVECRILPRRELAEGPISASVVRQALKDGDWALAERLVPPTTAAYLHSEKGQRVAARLREMDQVNHH